MWGRGLGVARENLRAMGRSTRHIAFLHRCLRGRGTARMRRVGVCCGLAWGRSDALDGVRSRDDARFEVIVDDHLARIDFVISSGDKNY